VVLLGGELRCTVNASAVREEQYRITPAEKPKRVLVVGGGPGGMEAAMVAAMRGHEVTLSEKKDRLGGQLLLAAAVPNKDPIGKLADYLASQLVKSGVRVRLNDEVTAKSVEESEPDVVILATGVTPFIPEISGADGDNVVLAEDVLCNRREVGQRIVILGGEQVGCDTAEFLAEKGKKVVLLRRGPTIAASIMPVLRQPILDRLAAKGVTMLTGLRYEQITPTGLEIITSDGREQTIEADTIVIATGGNANTELAQQLERKVPALHLVGDCVQPRDIMGAIADGARVGREI
jgi:NADPH-dependent 2,4-dienoyl-CoA reductase/sulfur reductase-like enzyme